MSTTPWPPTRERIAFLETIVRLAHYHLDGFDGTHDLAAAAEFLGDERLAAALELWEAVEWIEANRPAIYRERGRWGALHGDTDVIGKTLPEAVSALRARLKEESRGE